MEQNKMIKILFIGDIFGQPGIDNVKQNLPILLKEHNIDLVIAQAENVSNRKGFIAKDYYALKECGVDVFTLGNHVWAQNGIFEIINNNDIVRPLNIPNSYAGQGSVVVNIPNKNATIRVTSLMGIMFNKLLAPWYHEYAENFFDAIDNVIENQQKTDFHFVDFHAETTSEKAVLSLYLDGKVDAVCGTHTHVQTNDARVLPNGTCFISDAGMTGPSNAAIGANFEEVYKHMRYNSMVRFVVSPNKTQFNGVVLKLNTINKHENEIIKICIEPKGE